MTKPNMAENWIAWKEDTLHPFRSDIETVKVSKVDVLMSIPLSGVLSKLARLILHEVNSIFLNLKFNIFDDDPYFENILSIVNETVL